MAKDRELDLEVLEAGVAYTLYAAALVALAIALNNRNDPNSPRQDVSRHAKGLKDSLARCGVDKSIPVDVGNANDILQFLRRGEFVVEISDLLVRHHSRRQELIFLLTSVVGGVLTGSTGGVSEATRPAQAQAIRIGGELLVPKSVIIECFDTETMTPLRHFLQSTDWSEIIEAKPGVWGFAVDLKKLLTVVRKWFAKKGAS
jgi:hypothetical protein